MQARSYVDSSGVIFIGFWNGLFVSEYVVSYVHSNFQYAAIAVPENASHVTLLWQPVLNG